MEKKALFPLGQVVTTPGALQALETSGQLPEEFLRRHLTADWGDVCADDRQENEVALRNHFRLLSAYTTRSGQKLWIITEWDRSVTTLLLPCEY